MADSIYFLRQEKGTFRRLEDAQGSLGRPKAAQATGVTLHG